jgi:hypothetical protein
MSYENYRAAIEKLDTETAAIEYVAWQTQWLDDFRRHIVETKKTIAELESKLEAATAAGDNPQPILEDIEQSKRWVEERQTAIDVTLEEVKPENVAVAVAKQIAKRKEEMEVEQKWKSQTIEIGETYIIDPVNKKSFIEVACVVGTPLQLDDDVVEDEEPLAEVWDCFRGGSISVTPETEEEVKRLQDILANPGRYDFDTRQWESAYMDHCWDGGCDFGMDLEVDGFEEHEIMEGFHEQDDYYNVADYVADLFNRELLTHEKANTDTYYVIYGCHMVPETEW